jgi:hypothetical protein
VGKYFDEGVNRMPPDCKMKKKKKKKRNVNRKY